MESVVLPLLIIEDNELNAMMLQQRLEKRGYVVLWERNSHLALPLLAKQPVALILMDLSMPGLDGWQLARILKREAVSRQIPLFAVTAHAMPGDREKALAAGCDEYFTKPIDFSALIRLIARYLPVSSGETHDVGQKVR
jgi:CheY-like chemotaxis protein